VRKVSLAVLGTPMRDLCSGYVPASIVLAVILATPMGAAFAQDSKRLAATFDERFPAEATSTPPPLDEIPEVTKEHSVIKHAPKVIRRGLPSRLARSSMVGPRCHPASASSGSKSLQLQNKCADIFPVDRCTGRVVAL
jgi:hypothetical protein